MTMDLLKIFSKKTTSTGQTHATEAANPRQLKSYGDLPGDGAMQLSFTLPVEASPEAREAAKKYVEKLGLQNVQVATMEAMGRGLSYFVVYAQAVHSIDFTKVTVPKADFTKMDFEELEEFARKNLPRKLVIVGATTGTDAHTVGLDAIMNMKGYMGDFGLERYACFRAYNLRSQVSHEELIGKAVRLRADVLLVSKVVTQRGKHLEELKELAEQLKKEKGLQKPLLKIVGGPRMTHAQAEKLGYDAGFGPGTLPSEVASFIVQEYLRRSKSSNK
jgi:beta-lysine 5,6-aminomutase beta subunit